MTHDILKEARTRALEQKKKKVLAEPKAMAAPKKPAAPKLPIPAENRAATVPPPPRMNLSADSNLSEDLKAFERDLCEGSGEEESQESNSAASATSEVVYVAETSSGMNTENFFKGNFKKGNFPSENFGRKI